MGYEDDWLATLSDDRGEYLEDPPPLPMPTVAELRRGALHLCVSLEQLLTAAWGMSAASLADDDARVFEPRPPRRFGNVQQTPQARSRKPRSTRPRASCCRQRPLKGPRLRAHWRREAAD